MAELFKYQINKQNQLIFIIFQGSATLNSIKASMTKVVSDPQFSPDYNTLSDFSNCNVNLNQDELDEFHDFMKNELNSVTQRKAAYLTSKPNEVVLATLYSINLKKSSIEAEAFSTVEAALQFLEVDSAQLKTLKMQFRALKQEIKEKAAEELKIFAPQQL